MKFLKFFVFLVVGLVLAFILLGLLKPTVQYGHEITVDKPLKEAWAVHKDASKYSQWLDGFKSIELIDGKAGTLGSKYKVVVNPGEGQPDFEMIQTVKSLTEFDHVGVTFDNEMLVMDQRTSFAEKDGKTTIKTKSKVSGKGMMTRSTFAVMELFGGAFQTKEVENIEALKKVIEGNRTNYYSVPSVTEVKFN